MNSIFSYLLFEAPGIDAAWYAEADRNWAAISESLPVLIEEIIRHYESDVKARDALSRLGCMLMDRECIEEALALFEQDAACRRQTWWQQLRHAECVAMSGNVHSAFSRIEHMYANHVEARNGYASIAWRFRHAPVNLPESPWLCAKRDVSADRLSAGYMLNVAELAMMDYHPDEAEALIERAYQENAGLMDGFSRCAWAHFWPKKEYDSLIEWMERDRKTNRLSPRWLLNLAHAYALAGRFDSGRLLIEEAYKNDAALTDGYARCAWARFWPEKEHGMLVQWMTKDHESGRLSPVWTANLSRAYAAFGDLDAAIGLMEIACQADARIKDGYVSLARIHSLPRKEYVRMLDLCQMDDKASRLTPSGRLTLGEAYAYNGKMCEAESEVKKAYRADSALKDGHVRIARICRSLQRGYQKALILCELDMELDRLTDSGRYFLAETQMLLGFFKDALPQLLLIENMPPNGWVRAIQLWAGSLQWPLSSRETDDPILSTLLEHHAFSKQNEGQEDITVSKALADIAVMRERLVAMRQRTGLDHHSQIQFIVSRRYADNPTDDPMPFLNAKLYGVSASDLLVLYNEIILSESDRFETDTDEPFILDGGANVGTAIAYFKWLYPKARIVAFEPNPATFAVCKQNIELNGWKNVTLYPYALAGENGQLVFHCDQDMPMASTLLNRAEEEGRAFSSVTVEARTLGEFMDRPVDFLKLDVEGAERAVMDSISSRLFMVRCGIIEYHHGSPQNALSSILQTLEQAGFAYTIKEPFFIRHTTGLQHVTPRWSRSIFFIRHTESRGTRPA